MDGIGGDLKIADRYAVAKDDLAYDSARSLVPSVKTRSKGRQRV